MSFLSKLKILEEIMLRGEWPNEKALMTEVLSCSPSNFAGLKPSHLDDCINYGNSRLEDMGLEPVRERPEDDPGRCEDIWDDRPKTFVPHKWRWSNSAKKAVGIRADTVEIPIDEAEVFGAKGGFVSKETTYLSRFEVNELNDSLISADNEVSFAGSTEPVNIADFKSQVTIPGHWMEGNNGVCEKYPAEELEQGPSPEVSELGKRIREQKEFDKRVADIERREREIEQSLRAIDDMAKANGLLCEEPEDDI